MEWLDFSTVVYDALRDKSRREILALLYEKPRTAGNLSKKVKISRAAIDKHLIRLIDLGLIEKIHYSEPRSHYVYELTDDGKNLLEDLEDAVSQFITSQIESIDRKLEFLEQGFILGYLNKAQFTKDKEELLAKRRILLGEDEPTDSP